ncbi:MAG: DegV family protein [Clostridiales bacterium]|nr:DegV family protein [Clostridiales bacterium]
MKLRIVTDTAADCLEQDIANLGVEVIELPVTFDGETEPCRDSDLFWKTLISGKVARTSQPSPEVFRTLFTEAQENGDTLIYICMSSKLSGTYANALAVKEQVGYENVHIVDALHTTAAEKLLVMTACKLRDEGVDACEIVDRLNELKHRVKLYACIDTLKYLAGGGRISKATAAIGSLMNIKPLITYVDGGVRNFGKTIGTTLAMNKLLDVLEQSNIEWDYAPIPIYAYDAKNTQAFIKRANERGIALEEKYLTPIGPTIGTHIGPGGFGVVFVVKQ